MGDIRASDNDSMPPAPTEPQNEVTVLVTGFGPFLKTHPINPSHTITTLLPPTIPLPGKTSTTIRLLTHAPPLTVAYHPTATLIPHLLSTHTPDLVLHLGLAAGRTYYAAEKSSVRTGYGRNPDVEGRRWGAEESEREWGGRPERLETGLGFEGVWERWRKGCEGVEGVGRGEGEVEIRPSDDVGAFLCGFVYYASLAWFWERERETGKEGGVERPVLFLHVPACPEVGDVERGRDVAVELIKAMVGAWVAQREARALAAERAAEAEEGAEKEAEAEG